MSAKLDPGQLPEWSSGSAADRLVWARWAVGRNDGLYRSVGLELFALFDALQKPDAAVEDLHKVLAALAAGRAKPTPLGAGEPIFGSPGAVVVDMRPRWLGQLEAVRAIVEVLEPLASRERCRVLAFVCDYFGYTDLRNAVLEVRER
jgi:hypothetical protein